MVTGKGNREGGGVLQDASAALVQQPTLRSLILGFAYAQPKHGGEGALYVLLKRRRLRPSAAGFASCATSAASP